MFTVCFLCVSDIKNHRFHALKKISIWHVKSGWETCLNATWLWCVVSFLDICQNFLCKQFYIQTFLTKAYRRMCLRPNMYVDATPSMNFSIYYWLINTFNAKLAWHQYHCPPSGTKNIFLQHHQWSQTPQRLQIKTSNFPLCFQRLQQGKVTFH